MALVAVGSQSPLLRHRLSAASSLTLTRCLSHLRCQKRRVAKWPHWHALEEAHKGKGMPRDAWLEGFKNIINLAQSSKGFKRLNQMEQVLELADKLRQLRHAYSDQQPARDPSQASPSPSHSSSEPKRQGGNADGHSDGASHGGAASNSRLPDIKISVFQDGHLSSETSIPGGVLNFAGRFFQSRAMCSMLAKDIKLDEIVRLAELMNITGTIVIHEIPETQMRYVISVNGGTSVAHQRLDLPDLKIKTYRGAPEKLESITTISASSLTLAEKLLPAEARSALDSHGVSLDEVLKFAKDPSARGAKILDHKDVNEHKRVVVSFN